MGHTFSNNNYHLIWSTQERRNLIAPIHQQELIRYLVGIARRSEGQIIIGNCIENHLHVLARISLSVAVSDFVRKLKANSSGWMKRERGVMDFSWQAGFASFTVSSSHLNDVSAYINNQHEHHRRMPFERELRNFLVKHGVKFDPEHYLD